MAEFIKGRALSEGFFFDAAKPLLDAHFPDLVYSAGLLGFGSDVLGYDDSTSTDHMWGPRFYLFLRGDDLKRRDEILAPFPNRSPAPIKDTASIFPRRSRATSASVTCSRPMRAPSPC